MLLSVGSQPGFLFPWSGLGVFWEAFWGPCGVALGCFGEPGPRLGLGLADFGVTLARRHRENLRKLDLGSKTPRKLENTRTRLENTENTLENSSGLAETVRRNCSRKLSRLHCTLLHSTLFHFTPSMDILEFARVSYIERGR